MHETVARHRHRPVRLIAALFNVSLYFYIFYREKGESSSRWRTPAVNSTHPLTVSVPSSIVPTKIQIDILREFCPRPTGRVRLVGPEIRVLPPFTLDSDKSSNGNVLSLEIDIREAYLLLGTYKVDVTLMRCHDGEAKTTAGNATASCGAETELNNIINIGSHDYNGSKWAWISAPKCGGERSPECARSHPSQEDYIFTEIDRETQAPLLDNLVTLRDGRTALSKPASLLAASESSSIIRYFNELSNYELVCWIGDYDAGLYHRAFMGLFPLIGSQKPFKFKYLKLTDVSDPTKDFSETTHQTFDKCKIFFISYGIERFHAGVSTEEYGGEVATLLGHIEKSHPDETYPAWFLSPRSSTSTADEATACTESSGLQGRTPDRIHAFNQEVNRIFRERKVDSRIHFMDNSDITEAFWPIGTSGKDQEVMESQILSAVAMRCMEKIAQQVRAWRSANQIGTQSGLMKNGKLIPNNVLYKNPYKWGK